MPLPTNKAPHSKVLVDTGHPSNPREGTARPSPSRAQRSSSHLSNTACHLSNRVPREGTELHRLSQEGMELLSNSLSNSNNFPHRRAAIIPWVPPRVTTSHLLPHMACPNSSLWILSSSKEGTPCLSSFSSHPPSNPSNLPTKTLQMRPVERPQLLPIMLNHMVVDTNNKACPHLHPPPFLLLPQQLPGTLSLPLRDTLTTTIRQLGFPNGKSQSKPMTVTTRIDHIRRTVASKKYAALLSRISFEQKIEIEYSISGGFVCKLQTYVRIDQLHLNDFVNEDITPPNRCTDIDFVSETKLNITSLLLEYTIKRERVTSKFKTGLLYIQ
mmetsp:Transcript_1861/g.2614  ORF Transcript_1861/g.2614 Transcript_1861/m.2614 type:complete len:327 (-) Transcript_1861:3-983(-)